MSSLEDIWEKSQDMVIPGLAGAAGGAGLGAFLTSNKKRGETPSERRQRVVRNALIGSAMGGTAGAAFPAGLKMLGEASGGGAFGDSIENLITNSAILGTGGVLGFTGGSWAKNKILNQADVLRDIGLSQQELFGRLSQSGNIHPSMQNAARTLGLKPGKAVKLKDQASALGLALNQDFKGVFNGIKDSQIEVWKAAFITKASEEKFLERMKKAGLTPGMHPLAGGSSKERQIRLESRVWAERRYEKDAKKLISLEADDWTRRMVRDAGFDIHGDTISSSFKRMTDSTRWGNRMDKLKSLVGLGGLDEAGKIWGGIPTSSGKLKSILRRGVKAGFPGVGLAAGGLLASHFV